MKIDFFTIWIHYMVYKRKVFWDYLSREIFELLVKSYIWKLTFYLLKTFFYYMVNN